MDDRGRVTDRSLFRALGWGPGTFIHVEVDGGVAVVTSGPGGPGRLTTPGQLRLPATIRHQLGLRPGDRVLLVARPAAARLLLYAPAVIDALLASSGSSPSGGRG